MVSSLNEIMIFVNFPFKFIINGTLSNKVFFPRVHGDLEINECGGLLL